MIVKVKADSPNEKGRQKSLRKGVERERERVRKRERERERGIN